MIDLQIGTDIIEIERIRDAIERYGERFTTRLFTPRERQYCDRFGKNAPRHYAARFAAKEAVAKALGCGFGANLSFLEVEIGREADGRPIVALQGDAKRRFSNPHFTLSISHCHAYATAVALCTIG